MERHPISFRPTAAQLAWLKAQRQQRGINLSALVILALEAAMKADTSDSSTPSAPVEG